MLNLQSKFGQKLLVIGNWIAAVVTIDLVWFIITLPALIMLVLALSLPVNVVYGATIMIIWVMLAAFTVPATTAAYQAVSAWQRTDSGSFIKVTWLNYLKALTDWQSNVLTALIMCCWLTVFRISTANIAMHVAVLVIGLVLLALWNGNNYSKVADQRFLELVVAHPFKLLLSAIAMIGLFAINFELRLIFFILLFSMSLSALITYRLFNSRVEIDKEKQIG
ncbi:hypothetical protein Q7Q91_01510 [Lactiplantibacillus pentosus]|uniref:hypothetical protein n=1 Tax=Lactiplantibacillus pentosus TaxID=1589 RepID=UPI002708C6FB|nr:hypothetical protein [Lactiplantibacillus pentosus]MDO7803658.1 hypothetical protein [Lactiplantibacillus pentosus]